MVGDFIIFCTLLANGCAILNLKLKRLPGPGEELFVGSEPGVLDKIRDFIVSIRNFRLFIGLWNILLALLMFVVFSR